MPYPGCYWSLVCIQGPLLSFPAFYQACHYSTLKHATQIIIIITNSSISSSSAPPLVLTRMAIGGLPSKRQGRLGRPKEYRHPTCHSPLLLPLLPPSPSPSTSPSPTPVPLPSFMFVLHTYEASTASDTSESPYGTRLDTRLPV